MFDNMSFGNGIGVPIFLTLSITWILVTKRQDMKIRLYRWKGHTRHAPDPKVKLSSSASDVRGIKWPVIVM